MKKLIRKYEGFLWFAVIAFVTLLGIAVVISWRLNHLVRVKHLSPQGTFVKAESSAIQHVFSYVSAGNDVVIHLSEDRTVILTILQVFNTQSRYQAEKKNQCKKYAVDDFRNGTVLEMGVMCFTHLPGNEERWVHDPWENHFASLYR